VLVGHSSKSVHVFRKRSLTVAAPIGATSVSECFFRKTSPYFRMRALSHGWQLIAGPVVSESLIPGFIRPAVRSVPPRMAQHLGLCRVSIVEELENPEVASQWTCTDRELLVSLAATGRDEHDVALELLLCVGQALWEKLSPAQRKAYWLLVDQEINAGIAGEIDEDALEQKKVLLSGRSSAASRRRLERYGSASFAGTVAEYIHSLWHDVTIRSGPDFLPAPQLRRRLELLSRWYPPARGRRLFPRAQD